LCLALDIEAALAATTGFTCLFATLFLMSFTGHGVTGVPGLGFSGAPAFPKPEPEADEPEDSEEEEDEDADYPNQISLAPCFPRCMVPIPVRFLVMFVTVLLNINMVRSARLGRVPATFWVNYVLAVAGPLVLGAKARSDGWMTSAALGGGDVEEEEHHESGEPGARDRAVGGRTLTTDITHKGSPMGSAAHQDKQNNATG
jgi:hypothetical protein